MLGPGFHLPTSGGWWAEAPCGSEHQISPTATAKAVIFNQRWDPVILDTSNIMVLFENYGFY